MSAIHAGSVMSAARSAGGAFAPTIYGRVHANGLVLNSYDYAFDFDPAFIAADTDAALWLIMTSTNCYIRCGGGAAADLWYNTAGVSQGNPGAYTGTGADIFELGEQPDSVNIYNANNNTISNAPVFSAVGTYTSDDKSTFFAPTQDVKYGRRVIAALSLDFPDVVVETGEITQQFTFRKAGYDDYTITFRARGEAECEIV